MSCGTDHTNNIVGASQAVNGPAATGAVTLHAKPDHCPYCWWKLTKKGKCRNPECPARTGEDYAVPGWESIEEKNERMRAARIAGGFPVEQVSDQKKAAPPQAVADSVGSPAWYESVRQQFTATLPEPTPAQKNIGLLMMTDTWCYIVTPPMRQAMAACSEWLGTATLEQVREIFRHNYHLLQLGNAHVNEFIDKVRARGKELIAASKQEA